MLESRREWLRVCMRAWREVGDQVRAGTAAWEQRWARTMNDGSAECALARRLTLPEGPCILWGETGWCVRVMLAYMRLVRAGKVRAKREQSAPWHAKLIARRERERVARFVLLWVQGAARSTSEGVLR